MKFRIVRNNNQYKVQCKVSLFSRWEFHGTPEYHFDSETEATRYICLINPKWKPKKVWTVVASE